MDALRSPRQLLLFDDVMTALETQRDPGADYGEVFTRRWVVDLILDLVGYTPDRDLGSLSLIEPSCGTGAFLVPIVERLLESAAAHGRDMTSLDGAIRAFDLLEGNAELARKAVRQRLHDDGVDEDAARSIADTWITTGDFLLADEQPSSADFVVGNPPYIRLEAVPRPIMDAYRRVCPTMRGRSDIYVGFIERGLSLLRPAGVLGFICADRWMRNQYGADLRELVSGSYAIDTVITMHDVDAFEDEVSAYPAVVVVRNGEQGPANVVQARSGMESSDAERLAAWTHQRNRRRLRGRTFDASRVERWFEGRDSWPAGSPLQLQLVADLEKRFEPLESVETGTRVGIGVATGADEVFITRDPELVEEDRLLPLLQAADIASGTPAWRGSYLVNPWDEDGLVDLRKFPRLERYLSAEAAGLRRRHVARQRPAQWYRTIDRVHPDLLGREKLVIPDLKASAHPVLDRGDFYPHHNLYFVTSDGWDLEVLGGLLLSDVGNLFVGAYCVRMRGGTYRFQAQYLRRIRVPAVQVLTRQDRRQLARAFSERDVDAATACAVRLYGIDSEQASTLRPT